MHAIWFKFLVCAGLIFFAGTRVAKYADVIAEKTNLSRLWIGVLLVAAATSLPELFTGVGSVVFMDAPNLTIGDLFGANSYNLLNIAVLDLAHRGGPILSALSSGQLLTVVFSLIPLMLAATGIWLAKSGISAWSAWGIGIFSFAILISYCVLTRVLYAFEKKKSPRNAPATGDKKYNDISLRKAYIYYAMAAAVIMASGVWLAFIGKDLSQAMRLEESFVGSLFMGFVTTLPEITVSLAALFIGAKEIAVANMFGSNLFNMAIIFVNDALYRKGPILRSVSFDQINQALVVMAMSAVIIIALVTRSRKKVMGVSWYVPALIAIFILGAYLNFATGLK